MTTAAEKVVEYLKRHNTANEDGWVHARMITYFHGPNVNTLRRLVKEGVLEQRDTPQRGYPYFEVRLTRQQRLPDASEDTK